MSLIFMNLFYFFNLRLWSQVWLKKKKKKKRKEKKRPIVPPNVPGRYRTSCPPKTDFPLLDHFRNLARIQPFGSPSWNSASFAMWRLLITSLITSLSFCLARSLSPSLARSLPLSLSFPECISRIDTQRHAHST